MPERYIRAHGSSDLQDMFEAHSNVPNSWMCERNVAGLKVRIAMQRKLKAISPVTAFGVKARKVIRFPLIVIEISTTSIW